MTTTKKKTDTAIEDWQRNRATLAQQVEELTAEHDAAEIKVAEIKGAWSRGDATYTGADLAAATAEVERTSTLLSAQRAKLSAIEKRRPISLDLAHVLADRISEIFREPASVERTDSRKGVTVVPDTAMPSKYDGGIYSGKLVVSRDAAHLSSGIDAEQVDRLLRGLDIDAETTVTGTVAGREAVAIMVYGAVEDDRPVLTADPTRGELASFLRLTLTDVEARLRAPRERGGSDLDLVLPREGKLIALPALGTRSTTSKRDGRTVRTTSISWGIRMEHRDEEWAVHQGVVRQLTDQLGLPLRGLGKLVEVKHGVIVFESYVEGEVA